LENYFVIETVKNLPHIMAPSWPCFFKI